MNLSAIRRLLILSLLFCSFVRILNLCRSSEGVDFLTERRTNEEILNVRAWKERERFLFAQMKKKTMIMNAENGERSRAEEEDDDDDDDDREIKVSSFPFETEEEIQARKKIDALKGTASYAEHIVALNQTWFDRTYVREKLDYEKFVRCNEKNERGKASLLPIIGDVENATPDEMKRKVKLSWDVNDELRGLDAEISLALSSGGDDDATTTTTMKMDLESKLRTNEKKRVAMLAKSAAAEATNRAEKDGRGFSVNWGKCAVVGNSGLLRFSEYGKAIDSHDVVVRINQAPIRGYSRRVGLKVTHRVFNRLWTRAYYLSPYKLKRTNKEKEDELKKLKSKDPSRARHAMRQFKSSAFKGKTPWENNALEDNVAIIITRASLKEFGLLANQLKKYRPDVLPIRLSSKATTMSSKPLMAYREKLCKNGFGPYRGLNVPSSGFVAAYAMLSSELCKSVDVYGFGVEGMAQASKGLQTRAGEVLDRTNKKNSETNVTMSYHYFKGLGARAEGNDVHSFDTEEKAFEAYGEGKFLNFCKFDWKNPKSERNWNCGCRLEDVNMCKPTSVLSEEDCERGVDCTEDERELLKGEFEKEQKLPSADDTVADDALYSS